MADLFNVVAPLEPESSDGHDGDEHGGPSQQPRLVRVVPWRDPVVDALGHDPRAPYVEHFWLGVLGPTATWLIRRVASDFDLQPEGFELDLCDAARALGVGGRGGQHSPFQRAITRCVKFRLARWQGQELLAFRRSVPPLPRRLLLRLPRSVQELHSRWSIPEGSTSEVLRKRSRRLALHLVDVAECSEIVEVQLLKWRVHPSMAHDASKWAWNLRACAGTAGGRRGV